MIEPTIRTTMSGVFWPRLVWWEAAADVDAAAGWEVDVMDADELELEAMAAFSELAELSVVSAEEEALVDEEAATVDVVRAARDAEAADVSAEEAETEVALAELAGVEVEAATDEDFFLAADDDS